MGISNSFIMYRSFHEALSSLKDEEYGRMMRIINEYALNGTEPETNTELANVVFTLIKPQLDANAEKQQNYQRAVEAGKKGGKKTSLPKERIAELLKEGKTPSEIAEQLNCSRQAIYNFVNCKQTALQDSVNCKQTALQDSVNCKQTALQDSVNCKQTINDNVNNNVNDNVNNNDDEKKVVDSQTAVFPFTPKAIKDRLEALGYCFPDNDNTLISCSLSAFLPHDEKNIDYLDYLISKVKASYRPDSGSERNWVHWYLSVDIKHNMYKENLPGFEEWKKARVARQKIDMPAVCPSCGKSIVEKMPNVFYCSSCNSVIEFNKADGKWSAEKLPEASLATFQPPVAPDTMDIF